MLGASSPLTSLASEIKGQLEKNGQESTGCAVVSRAVVVHQAAWVTVGRCLQAIVVTAAGADRGQQPVNEPAKKQLGKTSIDCMWMDELKA